MIEPVVHLMTPGELIVFSVLLIVTGILFVLFCMAPEEKGNSMLVLTRKPEPNHDTILIGDSIRVQIQGVIGGKVKIGIEAPADVRVFRGELVHLRGELDGSRPFRPEIQTDNLPEDPGGVLAVNPNLFADSRS